MECPKCSKEMKNLGNLNNFYYISYPVQWDELHVCDDCKIKQNERMRGLSHDPVEGRNLETYTWNTPNNN